MLVMADTTELVNLGIQDTLAAWATTSSFVDQQRSPLAYFQMSAAFGSIPRCSLSEILELLASAKAAYVNFFEPMNFGKDDLPLGPDSERLRTMRGLTDFRTYARKHSSDSESLADLESDTNASNASRGSSTGSNSKEESDEGGDEDEASEEVVRLPTCSQKSALRT